MLLISQVLHVLWHTIWKWIFYITFCLFKLSVFLFILFSGILMTYFLWKKAMVSWPIGPKEVKRRRRVRPVQLSLTPARQMEQYLEGIFVRVVSISWFKKAPWLYILGTFHGKTNLPGTLKFYINQILVSCWIFIWIS